MKFKLSDICSYRKEKIAVSELSRKNYISTENMLLDKNGITVATALPKTVQTQKYKKGDVLVSNIRPYFKKYGLPMGLVDVLMMCLSLVPKMV